MRLAGLDVAAVAGKRVVFLGDSITQSGRYVTFLSYYLVEKPAALSPHFYYFQLLPGPFQQDAMLTDSIKSTLSRVGGKTLLIHNPGEFAKAIERGSLTTLASL